MKYLTIVVLLGIATSAMAYEVPENPDRKMSFGLNYNHGWNTTEYKFGSLLINDFTKQKTDFVMLDFMLPLNSVFTFQVRGGFGGATTESFVNEKIETNDRVVGFGIRAYLP